MSDEISSRKGKRSLSSNDNNSFVKNVTSRVSALLPSTITKWFSSPSSSNAGLNGSAPVAETSDSSTEDEALETSVTQPPSKKMRFSSPSTSYHNLPETKCTGTNTDPIETVIIVQSPLSKSTLKPETKFVSTPLRSPDEERTILERDKEISAYNLQNSFTSLGNSIVKKRKSLFDTPIDEKPYEKLPRIYSDRSLSQPYSKPGLLGSPFYSGQTRYGGASSSFINQPNIKHRKDTLVHNSGNNNNITISQTTRRVMELLENYSSPLIEAKRLSQFVRSPKTLDKSHTNNAYKTQELLVPSFAKILQIKKKSRLMDTTSAARQIMASNSSSLPYPSTKKNSSTNSKESSETFTTKMRTKLTRNRDKMTINDSSSTAPVHLPTAVLQIDQNNLPKFTLGGSVKEPVSVSTNKTTIGNSADPKNTSRATVGLLNSTTSEMPISENKISDNSSIELITSKPQKCINTNSYKFSSPVMILVGNTENSLTQSNYTFGSPERRIVEQSKEKETNKFLLIVGNESKKESKSISWKCNDCWVANNSDTNKCVCCGAKKPLNSDSKTNQCSVCKVVLDIKLSGKCVNCEKKDDDVKSTAKLSGNYSSKWKCNDCWVNNDNGLEKCACCGAVKPKVGGNNPPVSNTKSDDTSEWKCSDCLIKNKKSDDKCVACGGAAKPTGTLNKCDLFSQADNAKKNCDSMFLKITKSQSDKWKCPDCLVSNDKNRSTCICCEAEKPGTIKEADIKSFKFASKQNITFKFGIDPKQTPSDKITEPSSIKILDKTVNKSETNNNIVSKPFSYTFGIPKEKHSEKIITEEVTITEETPKETFKFGISKPLDSTPVLNTFFTSTGSDSLKFTESVTPTNSKEVNETVQAVPNIEELNSTMPNNQSASKPTGLFGIPLNTSKSTTATTSPVCGQTSTTAASKVSETTFTFSASGVKTPENFFTAAVTTASSTSSSFFTIQAHPTSVSADSFFQKSDPVLATSIPFLPNSELESSSLSLFNKTETVSTTVAPSPSLSIGPVFSFGNNSQNAQTEKPKFNFTFGNKSEMPSLFSVPTSNTGSNILLGNGLPSTSNTLSGGNGLASANSVGGNGLPSSSLSSGMLPGTTKRDKILWSSSSEASSTKMSSGNSLELSNNSLPAVQSSNLFAGQAKKDTKWPPSQNTDSIGSIKLSSGNSLDTSTLVVTPSRMFAPPEKKENMWSMSNENNNIFVTNAGTNNLQKPSNFTFGSSMQFNSNNVTPAPAFGSAAQPQPQNIFGMSSQQNNQPSLFTTALQNQNQPNIFGTQSVGNTAPSVGMFGTSTASAAPTFGTPNLSIPAFDTAQHNPVPAPTFNFGAQQTTGVFGFGQQQPQSQSGVYNFGAQAVGSPQRQFNIGTTGAPGTVSRRVIRKAVRRTTPR